MQEAKPTKGAEHPSFLARLTVFLCEQAIGPPRKACVPCKNLMNHACPTRAWGLQRAQATIAHHSSLRCTLSTTSPHPVLTLMWGMAGS